MAIVVAPLVAVMITQWVKTVWWNLSGKKPHWLFLDIFSFVACYGMSAYSWNVYSPDGHHLMIAFMVAVLHTVIVKGLFKFIGKINPDLAEELENGVDMNYAENRTVIGAMKTVVLSKKPRKR